MLTSLLCSALLGWERTTAASRNRIEVEEALNENTSRCDAPSEEAPAVKYFIQAEVNGREQWFPVTTSDAEQFDDVIQKQMNETEDSDSCFDLMPQTAVEQRASQQYNDGFEMRRWQPAADDLPSWYTSSDDEDSAATTDLWAMPDVGSGRKTFGWDVPKQLTSQKPVPLFQFNEPHAFRMDRNIPRFLYPMRIAMPRMLRRAYRQRTWGIVLVTKTALPIADDLTGVAKMFNNAEKAMVRIDCIWEMCWPIGQKKNRAQAGGS